VGRSFTNGGHDNMPLYSKVLKENNLSTINDMLPLYKDLGYLVSRENLKTILDRIIEHEDYTLLLLFKDNEIVGFSGLCRMMFYEKEGYYMRVLAFVIKSEYRNQGLGKVLLKKSEELAKEKDCHVITLNSGDREERDIAHKFYLKSGYKRKTSGFSKSL